MLYLLVSVVACVIGGVLAARDGGEPGDIAVMSVMAAVAWPLVAMLSVVWVFGWTLRFLFGRR